MKTTKIYLIENCYNDPNKVYIGKTINSRKHNHEKTYGKEIIYTIIDEINSIDYRDYKIIENYWIEQFKQWGFEIMNKNKGGGGPTKWSDELLSSNENQLRIEKIKNNKERAKKISRATKDIPLSEERKEKLRGPRPHLVGKKKKPLDEESKKKISNSLKGRDAYWIKGKKLSQDTKDRMSNSKKGKPSMLKGTKRLDLKGKPSPASKPILQYDLQGNFIQEWGSSSQAEKYMKGKVTNNINACCKNKLKTAYGYIWVFKNKNESTCDTIKNIDVSNNKKRFILQYDLQDNFIQEWESLTQASRELNIKISSISACLLGRTNRANNYIFKYKNK